MKLQVMLGAAVGLVASVLSWHGNRTPNLVSTFPNACTALVFLSLISLVVWFYAWRLRRQSYAAIWLVGGTISIAAGIVLGTALVLIGIKNCQHPSLTLLSLSFLGSLILAVICGSMASGLAHGYFAVRYWLSGGQSPNN